MRKAQIPKEYVFSILSYNREDGSFTWLETRGSVKAGRQAGSPQHSRGRTYIQIRIDKTYYKGHHLAWLFITGEWPSFDLDHEDGDGTNNKPGNLRPCTKAQNKANSRTYKNNKTGYKSVVYEKDTNRWYATIQCNGKRKKLPRCKTPEAAYRHYVLAAKELFGEFARLA